jgi:hypothetical protein
MLGTPVYPKFLPTGWPNVYSRIEKLVLRKAVLSDAETLQARSKNAPFWDTHKPLLLIRAKTQFKIQAVVGGFWLSRDSGHPYIAQHQSIWALKLPFSAVAKVTWHDMARTMAVVRDLATNRHPGTNVGFWANYYIKKNVRHLLDQAVSRLPGGPVRRNFVGLSPPCDRLGRYQPHET